MRPMRRIGVAFPGGDPASPSTWSGTPAGVIAGLREQGVEAVPLDVGAGGLLQAVTSNAVATRYLRRAPDLRTMVRRARGAARASPAMAWVNTAATSSELGESNDLDGIVQIGTGLTLRTGVPIVTYEDMTVAQNRHDPYEQYALLSEKALRARIERQRAAYEQAVACSFTTEWPAESARREYDVDPDRVHVVGIGCNPPVVAGERDWSAPRYLFVGVDWERKNGPLVLRTFDRIRRQLPDARLDVVGRHPRIDQPGVTGHGVLRREVPAERQVVERLFGEATCFVMPSLLEAAGIVYLEAAAVGIPVIGTSNGGAGWLIGQGGRVVSPDDDTELYDAMREFADPDVARRTGALGQARSSSFTWPAVAQRLINALDGESAEQWDDGSAAHETNGP